MIVQLYVLSNFVVNSTFFSEKLVAKGVRYSYYLCMHPEEITIKWLGASGFELRYGKRLVLVDPFLSRPYDATPRLPITRQDYRKFDMLLATHAHFDHFADVPYLAATVDAHIFMPRCGKKDVKKAWRTLHQSARTGNPDKWHAYEETGRIRLDELRVTPLPGFHEVFDVPTVWEAIKRIFGHTPRNEAIRRGLDLVRMHPYGPTYAMHFDWQDRGSRMLFFGSLSRHVYNVTPDTGRTDVLAIPYCPANRQWMKETARLVQRFQPKALLVHHFDLWLPPITLNLDLKTWRDRMEAQFPDVPIYFPKPLKEFTLEDVLAGK